MVGSCLQDHPILLRSSHSPRHLHVFSPRILCCASAVIRSVLCSGPRSRLGVWMCIQWMYIHPSSWTCSSLCPANRSGEPHVEGLQAPKLRGSGKFSAHGRHRVHKGHLRKFVNCIGLGTEWRPQISKISLIPQNPCVQRTKKTHRSFCP